MSAKLEPTQRLLSACTVIAGEDSERDCATLLLVVVEEEGAEEKG